MTNSKTIEKKRKSLLNELKEGASAKGITQEAIGTAADIRTNNVNRILTGKYSPYLDTVLAMADAAGYEVKLISK